MKKQEWLFVWLAKMFQMPNLFIQSCKMEIRFTEIEFRLSVQSMKIRLVTNFVFFSRSFLFSLHSNPIIIIMFISMDLCMRAQRQCPQFVIDAWWWTEILFCFAHITPEDRFCLNGGHYMNYRCCCNNIHLE